MNSKRSYHKWTEQETMQLYKIVQSSNRNWRAVGKAFPQFSLLQLQNKYTMIEKQYRLKQAHRTPAYSQNQSLLENDDTLQILLDLISKQSE
ncbi:Myb-like_DNA-binding domain-containing protein [Hexamita inflata]|uniref:Myb-like DNA-binding domain-containing protein n=1 Tax=Hexamita inflata TaxID=28002 RepID=A0AA86TWE6_9EUKA|nr:Myb-like DNA-binding domain-containing protein [Hexamita inflata]CAI9953219.1 Myb-like DNA-binding domain-containing protein [Hexamita inflata]